MSIMDDTTMDLDIVEEQVKTLYSNISTPVKEIDFSQIKKLVETRCVENNVKILDKIYGFEDGCPICMNDYTNDTWIVLHPCGHLLCDTCLSKVNNLAYVQRQSRKCPVCRIQAKWIGSTNHNLNTHTITSDYLATTQPSNIFNQTTSIVPTIQAFPLGYFAQQNIRYNSRYGGNGIISNSVLTPGIIIPSKALFIDNVTIPNSQIQPQIQSQISTQIFEIDGKMETVGNISIVADELQSTNGIDLLIMFDVSGSMRQVSQEGINILKYTVDCLDSRDRLSVITFDSDANQLFALQPMITSIKSICKSQIDNCFTAGSTNMEGAIDLLIKVMNDGIIENRPFKIIILSDGNPDIGKEGTHLINKLYEGDIKPEIYSCTFGNNVRADVMKLFLTEQNLLNYHHIENMTMFKSLVSNIGLDKNIVVGKKILVKFKNLKVLSNLAKISIDDPSVTEIIFEQIKTSDVFTVPIIFNLEKESSIKVTYIDNFCENKELDNQFIDNLDNFVKNNYWYKKIGEQIKDIIAMVKNDEKKESLNKIVLNTTAENLGDFLQEITELITQTKLMITNEDNNTYYNCCTVSAIRSYSHASGSANVIYKSKSNYSTGLPKFA